MIDSGVHADHPHVGGVAGGIGIDEQGVAHDDYVDRLGHGTAVTAAIREKAPDAEIFAIKVFDRELAATGQALVAACEQAVDARAHIVNLSLGTQNTDHEAALADVDCAPATSSGAIVVAAGEQDGVALAAGIAAGRLGGARSIGPCRATACEIDRLNRKGAVFRATGFPRPIPGVPPDANLKGLSFAVANVTGTVARLLAEDADGDAVTVLTRAFERGRFG